MGSSVWHERVSPAPNGKRAVLVVVDSLRADLIRPDWTPQLAALRDAACQYAAHRSVFPSTTRTASASIATGCLPQAHGLEGNAVALREHGRLVRLSTGKAEFRERWRAATGRTLLRPTLAERLAGAGGAVIFSNASPGAAHMQDPEGHGWLLNRAGSHGPGLRALPPGQHLDAPKGNAGDARTTDRFVSEVLCPGGPALGVLWLSEPDNTGHHHPLGGPEHRAALAGVDACVGHVLEAVRRLDGAGDDLLLVVTSDHGQETVERVIDVDALLVEGGLKAAPDSAEIVAVSQGTAVLFYLEPGSPTRERALLGFLAGQEWAAEVYAGDGMRALGLAPTAELRVAVSLRKSDAPNTHGVPGLSDIARDPIDGLNHVGCGQHGGTGAYEQQPFLLLHGGGFPTHSRRTEPTRPCDIAPTVLRLLGQPTAGTEGTPLVP